MIGIDAVPVNDGGHVGEDHVKEIFVNFAQRIALTNPAHSHSNHVQVGHMLQQFVKMQEAGGNGFEEPSRDDRMEQ